MEIKGTAVVAVRNFVKDRYPGKYDQWLNALPKDSKLIFTEAIEATKWYPVDHAAAQPTKVIAGMFFNNDLKKGAWESGRYSAEIALKGFYKIFVHVSSPSYLIARASRVFSTYYRPCEMKTYKNEGSNLILHITGMPDCDKVVEYRIGGWIEKALEISGCTDIRVEITRSAALKDELTEFTIHWT